MEILNQTLRACHFCGKEFMLRNKHKRIFCSKECSKKCYIEKFGLKSIYPNLPTGTVGTMSELIVFTDLLKKGFEVFRALSPSCSCDLAILKDKQLIRVEVTSGYKRLKDNGLSYPKKDSLKFDLLAVVVGNEVYYQPDEVIKNEN